MLRSASALLVGEFLTLFGLWLAWPPLAFIGAGGQAIAWGVLRETGDGA